MAGKGRILIPGLYDSSDESENDDGAAEPAVDDVVVDPTPSEPAASQELIETESEEYSDPASVETAREQTEDEEEEEEEYDPTAPAMNLNPKAAAMMSKSGASKESSDEPPPPGVDIPQEEHEGEGEAGQDDHYFVVDAHNRTVQILPAGYSEKLYSTLEKIPADTFVTLNERVYNPNPDDDDHFYCANCVMSFRICCPKHPLYRILDRPVAGPIDDRARKTAPAFIRIKTSSIPNAGMGAFTNNDLPVGLVFGPYQGILSKEADNRGYSWEIRNVDAPSMFLDGSDPKYSNWMRYINSPRHNQEQNLIAFQYNGSVYYRVSKAIDADQELLVWYGAKYGESLGVFSTKKSNRNRPLPNKDAKNPFIM